MTARQNRISHLVLSLVVLMLVLFGIGDAGTIGDVMVMVVFGGLAFRAWALAERRWAMEPLKRANGSDQRIPTESRPLQTLFVLRKSRGWRMLVAQVCMWTCLFCAVESLEDIFLDALDACKAATDVEQTGLATMVSVSSPESKPQPIHITVAVEEARKDAENAFLLLLTSLLSAGICRAWAVAEWRHGTPPMRSAFPKSIFPMPKLSTSKAWLLIGSYVAAMAALIVSVVAWPLIFSDSLDRWEFVFVSLVACVASNRLLHFLGQPACSERDRPPVLARSATV